MKYDFDIIVIGGGAAGLFAASVAKALGAKVCIIEKKRMGGDCTWYGCMPSKTLLKSASIANHINTCYQYGLRLPDSTFPGTASVMQHVRDIIESIGEHETPEAFKLRGIEAIIGSPTFVDKNTIKVNDSKLRAKKIILCTGSHPMIPNIPGLSDVEYLTNETIFSLTKLPQSIIVLGGGPIGVEMAQAMARLGVKVTLVEMADKILLREEEGLVEFITNKLIQDKVTIMTSKKAVGVVTKDNLIEVTVQGSDGSIERIEAEKILVAVGRVPNLEGLELEKAGVEYNSRGVVVNHYLQTTAKNIFACGDISGPYQFSHVASYGASVAVRNALFKRVAWAKTSYENIVWATFTSPELAHLGFTEEEARHKLNNKVKVYNISYVSSDRATTDNAKEGAVKVITNTKGMIVGAHIVGSEASELMQGFIIAKACKIPLYKLGGLMYMYPTLSELVKKVAALALVEKAANPWVKKLISWLKNI